MYNKYFPKLRIKRKNNNKKPWLIEGLKKFIKQKKNEIYLKFQKVNSARNDELYKVVRKKCSSSWKWLKNIFIMIFLLSIVR